MNSKPDGAGTTIPAIGISIQVGLDDTRSVVFQAHVPFDCSDVYLNGALDKLFKASTRQKSILALPGLRKRLAREETDQKRAAEDMLRLDVENDLVNSNRERATAEGRRVAKATPLDIQREQKNRADRTNAQITYERKAEEIRYLRTEIEELEKTLEG